MLRVIENSRHDIAADVSVTYCAAHAVPEYVASRHVTSNRRSLPITKNNYSINDRPRFRYHRCWDSAADLGRATPYASPR